MRRALAAAVLAGAALVAAPARAEVAAVSDAGFVVHLTTDVTATPAQAWAALVVPAQWWDGEHTYSGDPANLTLDPHPGGCFCERLPRGGGVEHMRVLYAAPGKALRLSGALGPLQSEALTGTLTITLTPKAGGTQIAWDYVVGGYMRPKPAAIAPVVDRVLAEQLGRLKARLARF
ncbi:MAG: SRPBCC family protein [Novosphingobium sp.]|nr:SRPBCC family protein [Novosphingobium sp.]